MKKKPKFEDDGRVIAPMNVEGMPWYTQNDLDGKNTNIDIKNPEYKKDTRKYILYALLAALAIGAVFALCAFIFIFLSVNVWLK